MCENQTLEFACILALCSSCANRTEEFAYSNTGCCFIEANQLTPHFVKPNRSLEAKGDRDCCLAMRSSEHDRVTLTFCYIGANTDEKAELFSQQNDAVSELQGNCSINNVVGCCAKMDAPTCIASSLCHGFGQSHDIVTGFRFYFRDPFFTYRFGVGDGSNCVVIVFRHATELPMCPNERTFNFELAFVSTGLRPDAFEILVAISVIEWTKGHGGGSRRGFMNLAQWQLCSSHRVIRHPLSLHSVPKPLQMPLR